MADSTPSPKSSTEAPPEVPADALPADTELREDGVPDILEIFGAAPLVDAEAAAAAEAEEDTERLVAPEVDDAVPRPELADDGDADEPAEQPALEHDLDADTSDATLDAPPAPEAAPRAETPVAAAPAPTLPDPTPALDALRGEMGGTMLLLEQRMGALEETLDGVAKQASFLPPKLRGLGKKVDELSSSIGDGRLRELFGELVSLVDLLDAGIAETADPAAQRTLAAVSTRLKQCFETRGLVGVDTDGPFDPTRHQAAERRVVNDQAQDGMVVEVFRRGWRDAHSVLRYADVAVGAYEPQADDAPSDDDAARDDEPTDNGPELAQATLTPGNVRAAAAPRRNQPTNSPDENEGDTDRTAAKASSRNTKTDDKDDA